MTKLVDVVGPNESCDSSEETAKQPAVSKLMCVTLRSGPLHSQVAF